MEIRQTLSPENEDLWLLKSKFWEFVSSDMPGLPSESEDQKFLFCAYEKNKHIGGICGNVYWDGLEIDTLWVDEDYRGRRTGQSLLEAAERFAIENNAVIAFLKTVNAREFYEKAGYRVYGVLEDRPIGTLLYHMKKRLDESGPAVPST